MRTNCVSSLNDPTTRARTSQIQAAHAETFRWLFDSTAANFHDWLCDKAPNDGPIFWIQGKPGSGKSTLMKFAMQDNALLEILNTCTTRTWIFAGFFFHDRGSELQKSLTGMLQEIIGSLLQQHPALVQVVIHTYNELVKTQKVRRPAWNFEALKRAMLSIVEQRHIHIQVFLFLDALDEHHGENELLALLLKDIVKSIDDHWVRLKLCLASRSWPVFAHHFGNCPGFAIHDHTALDIRNYIEVQLDISERLRRFSTAQAALQRIVQLLAEKARGVFIWVRLVVDLVSRGLRDGTPYTAIEDQITKMPEELKDLYTDTLRRVTPDYSTEAYIMLQMVLCSVIPLPLKTFMAGVNLVQAAMKSPDLVPRDITNLGAEDDATTESQKNRLASRSGGLLEVAVALAKKRTVAEDDENTEQDDDEILVVQFIHQTVREYVGLSTQGLGLVNVDPQVSSKDGSIFLLQSCVAQDQWVSCIKRDVFSYARKAIESIEDQETKQTNKDNVVRSWSSHDPDLIRVVIIELVLRALPISGPFDLAWFLGGRSEPFFQALKRSSDIDQDMVSLSPSMPVRVNIRGNIRGPQSRNVSGYKATLEKLAVAMDFPESIVIAPDGSLIIRGLLHVAVSGIKVNKGHRKRDATRTMKYILDLGYPIDGLDASILPHISPSIRLDVSKAVPALVVALINTNVDEETRVIYVKQLLESGASPNGQVSIEVFQNFTNDWRKFLATYLQICVGQCSAAIVRLMLEYGADVDDESHDGLDLYRTACLRGDHAVIQVLLDFGVSRRPMIAPNECLRVLALIPTFASIAPIRHFAAPLLGQVMKWDLERIEALGIEIGISNNIQVPTQLSTDEGAG